MKYCAACEDLFNPRVSKIEKYCSADCYYAATGDHLGPCKECGDDFDPDYTTCCVSTARVLATPDTITPDVWKALAEAAGTLGGDDAR